jgi:two-component system response regulator HydG
LEAAHLPEPDTNTAKNKSMDIKDNERMLILKALKQTDYNKTKAAEILGVSRRTLHNKIKEYELEV